MRNAINMLTLVVAMQVFFLGTSYGYEWYGGWGLGFVSLICAATYYVRMETHTRLMKWASEDVTHPGLRKYLQTQQEARMAVMTMPRTLWGRFMATAMEVGFFLCVYFVCGIHWGCVALTAYVVVPTAALSLAHHYGDRKAHTKHPVPNS